MSPPATRRHRALVLVRRLLQRKGSPYFVLFLVLAATGLAGFLASVMLLWAGLKSPGIRYPVCVALAYLVFLFQLYLYVLFHRRKVHARVDLVNSIEVDDALETAADVSDDVASLTASVDAPYPVPAATTSADSAPGEGSSWLGKVFDGGGRGGGGGDDGGAAIVVLIVIVVVVVVALVASLLVLLEAPVLLAEVLVDGVLMASLARRLRRVNRQDWVFSVVQRTLVPTLIVAVVFMVGGFALEAIQPGATTMGEALARK
jgi:hypothetical protein